MVLNKRKSIIATLFFVLSFNVFGLAVPKLEGRVNDYAGIISKNTEAKITEYLASLENSTGIQMAVLTVQSLEGEDIASFSIKTAEKWKLGEKDKDNGALLVVAYAERTVRIEVGYGLEESLTDAKCGLIIRNVIIPEFREGRYSEGILKGIQNMGGIASNNVELVSDAVLNGTDEGDEALAGVVFMIVWLIFVLAIIMSKGGIFKWIFLSKVLGSSGNHKSNLHIHTSNFNSSSFGGGSSFRGFSGGGGGFGGGGASGHW